MRFLLPLLFFFHLAGAQNPACTLAINIQDSIGAATYDLIHRASEKAATEKCVSILLKINTPGGSLQSTRLITEHILSSALPFLCVISPVGGHAGSAGAIILQACHVAGGLTATNLGAATPVSGTGEAIPQDLRNKLINDTVSWLEAMTDLRGRNKDFSKKIITEGKAVTTEEAVKMKALDISAPSIEDFLKQSVGRKYKNQEKAEFTVEVGTLIEFESDIRFKILQWISEPEWAYLLFMGALLLLYAEFSNPGLFLPGVAGAILLILSMIAFHKLEATFGGQALMVLGLLFWVAELFIASKGILGIAGTLSFVIGSFLLFDVETVGYDVPTAMILTTALTFGGLSTALTYLAAKSLNRKPHDHDLQMKSQKIKLMSVATDGLTGQAELLGEIWNFESDVVLKLSDEVEFVQRNKLTIQLKKKT